MKQEQEDMVSLNEIANQLKDVENGVNSMVVPMLKDAIKDSNKHNTKLFVLCIIELIVIVILGVYSQFIISKQGEKYEEFLSQFEFETSEIYQDLDSSDGGDAIINSGININE